MAEALSQRNRLTIGEAAKNVGLTPRAVRYYELIGLIQPALRERHNYRLYDEKALDELRLIARCRAIGLTVAEIRVLCAVAAEGTADTRKTAVMNEQLRHTEALIGKLLSVRQELRQQLGLQETSADPDEKVKAGFWGEPEPRRRMA